MAKTVIPALVINIGIKRLKVARVASKGVSFPKKAINVFVNLKLHIWWKDLNALLAILLNFSIRLPNNASVVKKGKNIELRARNANAPRTSLLKHKNNV
jgi:hypothetical protein